MVVTGALTTAILVTPVAMWLAHRVGLVDRPGPLKVHAKPVPYLGGLGVASAMVWGAGATRPSLLVPLLAALALGIVDDATDISPIARIGGEAVVGVAVGVCVPLWEPRLLGIAFAAAVTIVLCNSVNMIDGLDGLAGGVSLVAVAGFFIVLAGDGATLALALGAGLAAFLAFNLPPAGVYLGDGGAYLVGTALASLFLLGCRPGSGASFGAAALLVGYPLAEFVLTVVRRAVRRSSPLRGDRHHVYDQLSARGASTGLAVAGCVGVQVLLVGIGVSVAPRSTAAGLAAAAGCGMMILVTGALGGFLTPGTRRP